MAEYDTTIRIGTQADLSGGVQTEKQYDRLIAKAKELGKQGTASGKQVEASLGGVSRAAGLLRKVIGGFGAVGLLTGLVGAIEKVKKSFGEAKKEADALAAAKSKAEHKDAVEALGKSYEKLAEAARTASEALRHNNEMLDISVKNARDLEDAQLNLAEQKELAAIDDSDPAAGEMRAQISARYAQRRGALAASRGKEDVVYQRQKLQEEADLKRSQAVGIEGAAGETDKLIAAAKGRLSAAETRAYEENDEDATSWYSAWGQNIKNIVTGNWGKVGDNRTAEGNAVRDKAKAEAEELEAEIKLLEEQKAAKLKEAERLRKEADRAEEKKKALGGQIAVADVRRQAADVSGRASVVAADTALGKKEAQIARDEDIIAAGPGRIAAIKAKIAAAEQQKQAAVDANTKEQQDAEMARLALDRFNAAGHRRNGTGVQAQRSALEEDVDRETAEATQSRVRLQSTLATLAETIKGLNADLKKVEREVDAATRRQNTVNAEVSGS